MGVELGDIFEKHETELSDLAGKVVAVDAYNTLYQFLSIIRQRDGTPLKNASGEVTSHLSGFLYRTTNLIEVGIKPVFVFDGKPPGFKAQTLEARNNTRHEAMQRWQDAIAEGEEEKAFVHAQASSHLKGSMVEDAKALLGYMGVPVVQAPSEGEAQAAHMVLSGDADFAASQDYDSLLFGAPRVVRNLTVTGKRKLPRKNIYIDVKPEIIDLAEGLNASGITREQLIDIALLVGTDYNTGLKRVGPKTALKLVKQYGGIEAVLAEKGVGIENLQEIKDLFLYPEVSSDYEISWKSPKEAEITDFLCRKHDFSEVRVKGAVNRLIEASDAGQQTLDQWF
ncbi:MAG: flap endonuclease-1 [Methanosarcinales archaeon]|nr:flap endonuclease-1 [ANME-2 cluster archaeon]MDW7775969.1 flap endonuclease-1 [Methanosarcinales archaeon]